MSRDRSYTRGGGSYLYEVDFRDGKHYIKRGGKPIGVVVKNVPGDLSLSELSGFYGWARKQSVPNGSLPKMYITDVEESGKCSSQRTTEA